MVITLSDTTSAQISSALLSARRNAGSPASGMVLTLIIVSDTSGYPAALDAAMSAGREHPCRILLMVTGSARQAAGLEAEVRIGEDTPGEVVVVRMQGPLAQHPASVLRPLLLPDSPVVVWWPGSSPHNQTSDSLAELADRRITDAAAGRQPRRELARRADRLVPGDVDLAWTRITGWRTLLAAALDQFPAHVTQAVVEAERGNPSADLLAGWLECRLERPVRQVATTGPGITAARLTTAAGDIAITRPDGRLASYAVPGQPNRLVALKRREADDLIAEELRRMDRDPIYEEVLSALQERGARRRRTSATSAGARPDRAEPGSAGPDSAGSDRAGSDRAGSDRAQPDDRTHAERDTGNTPTAAAARNQSAAKQTNQKAAAKRPVRSSASRQAATKTTAQTTGTKPSGAAKKSTTKKSTTKKSAAKKSAAKKSATKNPTAKKAASKKSPAKKTPAKKTPAKKTATRTSSGKKAAISMSASRSAGRSGGGSR